MACAICKTRREKRHCPGIQGEICTVCCGTQREETIDCPMDCEHLRTARLHESLNQDPTGLPNRDFPVPRDFLDKHVQLVTVLQLAILEAALQAKAIDFDIREALDGLIRTYQTLGSGLYYESRPPNPIAARIFDAVQNRVAEVRKLETERAIHKLQDSEFLTTLVFLQRMEYALNNGRKRGRRFIESLFEAVAPFLKEEQPASSPLIIS